VTERAARAFAAIEKECLPVCNQIEG
jgi:hypothetical protein